MNSEPHINSLPDTDTTDSDRELDDLAEKRGSYYIARALLGEMDDTPSRLQASSNRRLQHASPRRSGYGPQYGEDSAPVEDQSRDDEGYGKLRQQIAPVREQLEQRAIERVRHKAEKMGINPDAAERAHRDRRAGIATSFGR